MPMKRDWTVEIQVKHHQYINVCIYVHATKCLGEYRLLVSVDRISNLNVSVSSEHHRVCKHFSIAAMAGDHVDGHSATCE